MRGLKGRLHVVEWEVMGISWDEVWCCSKGQKGETKVRQVLEAAEWPSAVLQVESTAGYRC